MIIMTVDGRMKGISEGAGTKELGEWMREYGSEVAINMDGGGSTTLFVADGKGGTRRLTTSRVYRKVAAPLGIFRIKEDSRNPAGE